MSQETEKPENQKDYNYRPKHIFISTIDSNLVTKSRVFKIYICLAIGNTAALERRLKNHLDAVVLFVPKLADYRSAEQSLVVGHG